MNTSTDELRVRFINRPEQFCCHNGRHVAEALVTGSVDGWYIERYACRELTAWYTQERGVFNSKGERIPVEVIR